MNARSTQKGLSLVEAILVIGIVASLLIYGLSYFAGVSAQAEAYELSNDLIEMRDRIRRYYRGRQDFGTPALNNTLVRNRNLVPTRLRGAGATDIRTPVTPAIVVDSVAANLQMRFVFTVQGEVCTSLLPYITDQFLEIRITSALGGERVIRSAAAPDPAIAAAGEECSEAGSATYDLRTT